MPGQKFDAKVTRSWLSRCRASIAAEREQLDDLDAAIGDADHGTNLDRGFSAVVTKLVTLDDLGPGQLLLLSGSILISTMGGASGPLWGTFLRRVGRAIGTDTDLSPLQLADALDLGVAGIAELGGAAEGDKTMLDAFLPAMRAFRIVAVTDDLASAAQCAYDGAKAGAEATSVLVGRKGRSSYLGDRGIGHPDAGATASVLLFGALLDAVNNPIEFDIDGNPRE